METIQKPELNLLQTGSSLKTLQVAAKAGMIMPTHHATKEAVLVVQKGTALLKMPAVQHFLKKGMTFTIPAGIEHSLEIKHDFEALAIMAVDANIQFQNK